MAKSSTRRVTIYINGKEEDASGWQIFSYGKLGEVTENIRTFALPFESKPFTFKMKYTYDSFNRIQQMTYPDGEKVNYFYNLGGMLDSIGGSKDTSNYAYVSHIAYNRFELKDSVRYGNGSLTTYRYDKPLRLDSLISYTGDAAANRMQLVKYKYDAVGNIMSIANYADTVSGLGGRYDVIYNYDALYRLTSAQGAWNGVPDTNYAVRMQYLPNGRIIKKVVENTATIRNHNFDRSVGYDREYIYFSGTSKLNKIAETNGLTQYFNWDGNGNLIENTNISEGCIRQYCWDEDNRLQGAIDCHYASYYQYDANGERTYKLTGSNSQQGQNANMHNFSILYNPTLYASPYVVCTPNGYTKHYYAESERIASKIGTGCLADLCSSINLSADFNKDTCDINEYLYDCDVYNDSFMQKVIKNKEHVKRVMECLHSTVEANATEISALYQFTTCSNEVESECYWYHPDHLGSSSWITFTDGKAVQHLHYLPWGEDFVDQRLTSWSARYSFSAKERDVETGLSYFGSRYYSSDLSIWLSVDPMSDKYPSLSPYVYCADNPVKLTDPDGRWIPGLDEDNNIIVTQEEGDDLNSFREFMGAAYSDDEIQNMYGQMQDGTINLTKTYGNEFQIMTNALNDAKKDPFFTQNQNYNCWGASLALMRGEELYGNGPDSFFPWSRDGVGLNSPTLFDFALNNYVPVKQEEASVGKTIMRYGVPVFGATTHASIFLGVDNSGNEYTFSKDGWNARPVVYNSRLLGYGMVMGRAPYESGYYVKK